MTTIILGTGNAISAHATLALRAQGQQVFRVGLSDGGHPVDWALDVTDEKSWAKLAEVEQFQRPANFLYTVGVGDPSVFSLASCSDIELQTRVNIGGLQGFFSFLARRVNEPQLTSSVVVITSLNSRIPTAGYSAYCATKAGAAMLCRVAAIELAPMYRINMVAPGPFNFKTMTRAAEIIRSNPKLLDRHLLDKRLTTVDDIWKAIAFLMSDASSWITGCELPVDGGLHLIAGST